MFHRLPAHRSNIRHTRFLDSTIRSSLNPWTNLSIPTYSRRRLSSHPTSETTKTVHKSTTNRTKPKLSHGMNIGRSLLQFQIDRMLKVFLQILASFTFFSQRQCRHRLQLRAHTTIHTHTYGNDDGPIPSARTKRYTFLQFRRLRASLSSSWRITG
jgi:hypothetical protein